MPNEALKKLASVLLLLPPPPPHALYPELKATYNATLSSVLSSASGIASNSLSTVALEIAVPCPHHYLPGETHRPRSLIYNQTHRLLAGLYSLISAICARDSINTEGEGGVNTRVLLIAYPKDKESSKLLQGPVVGLPALALSQRAWQRVFSVHSEEGELLLKQFLHSSSVSQPRWDIEEVDAGVSATSLAEELPPPKSRQGMHYSVAVGGTFDHLHAGHKLLLTMATLLLEPPGQSDKGRRIIVGITQDELLRNKRYASFLESWETRQRSVSDFLLALLDYSAPAATPPAIYQVSRTGLNGKEVHLKLDPALVIEFVAISDPFGPTITDESISALVVSAETRGGGQAVNEKREELGWPSLEVFEVDVLEADEPGDRGWAEGKFDSKISSTELRRRQSEKAKQLHDNAPG
jgi:phosphopantetheine adenylyltransferase